MIEIDIKKLMIIITDNQNSTIIGVINYTGNFYKIRKYSVII